MRKTSGLRIDPNLAGPYRREFGGGEDLQRDHHLQQERRFQAPPNSGPELRRIPDPVRLHDDHGQRRLLQQQVRRQKGGRNRRRPGEQFQHLAQQLMLLLRKVGPVHRPSRDQVRAGHAVRRRIDETRVADSAFDRLVVSQIRDSPASRRGKDSPSSDRASKGPSAGQTESPRRPAEAANQVASAWPPGSLSAHESRPRRLCIQGAYRPNSARDKVRPAFSNSRCGWPIITRRNFRLLFRSRQERSGYGDILHRTARQLELRRHKIEIQLLAPWNVCRPDAPPDAAAARLVRERETRR